MSTSVSGKSVSSRSLGGAASLEANMVIQRPVRRPPQRAFGVAKSYVCPYTASGLTMFADILLIGGHAHPHKWPSSFIRLAFSGLETGPTSVRITDIGGDQAAFARVLRGTRRAHYRCEP